VLFAPGWLFSSLVGAFGAWGLYEIAEMTHARTSPARIAIVLVAGGLPLAFLVATGGALPWLGPGAVIAAMATLVGVVALAGPEGGPHDRALTFLGAAYVGLLFPYLALVRNLDDGAALLIFTLLVVIASDTGAYFAGIHLGRTRLAPRVSPNKTIEGSVAGFVSAVAAALVLGAVMFAWMDALAMAAFGFALSALAQLGDLANSAFKRCAGTKESGWLFPGHGGLLDRTSSLVFASVFTYYWAK
jgi:phosphatidate cytidylyltransferase